MIVKCGMAKVSPQKNPICKTKRLGIVKTAGDNEMVMRLISVDNLINLYAHSLNPRIHTFEELLEMNALVEYMDIPLSCAILYVS